MKCGHESCLISADHQCRLEFRTLKSKIRNTDLIQYDTRIGNISAENDDDFLFNCFVDSKALSIALDINSPGSIISGRTGSGKTAILRYIEKHKKVARIEPTEMALEYISNSDIFRFLFDIGADLDILFQTIWKHVLCIEYIRLRNDISDRSNSKKWFSHSIYDFFRSEAEKRAVDYLKVWQEKFWISIDENVKEIVNRLEEQIQAEIGVDISKFKSKAGYGRNLSIDQKYEFVSRARKIIDGEQLRELSKVLDLLKNVDSRNKWIEPCFILIDNLDDRWVDESFKYKLINSLIEAMKSFRKIDKLKIIIALRADIIERSIQENDSSGFQREKYKDYIIELKWSEAELKRLVNSRINHLYKRKYTSQNVFFEDIFTTTIKGEKPFQYLIERTLMRPRDTIAFVNKCLEKAENKISVNSSDVKNAERDYSIERKQALLDEWRTAFPTLVHAFSIFSDGKEVLSFDETAVKEFCEQIAFPICSESKIERDPFYSLASRLFPEKGNVIIGDYLKFSKYVFSILYRVGAIGIKRPDTPYDYYFMSGHLYSEDEIGVGYKFKLVKMLHSAFGIRGE